MIGRQTPKIRRAVASEAAALTDLIMRSKAYWGYDDAFLESCREELTVSGDDIENNEFWVAETDNLVGVYKLIPNAPEPDMRSDAPPETPPEMPSEIRVASARIYVHLVFVDPSMIGTGLGKQLWNHLEIRARAIGAKAIYLEADPFARPFYERMGMKVIGETPSGSIPGRMLPVMEKQFSWKHP